MTSPALNPRLWNRLGLMSGWFSWRWRYTNPARASSPNRMEARGHGVHPFIGPSMRPDTSPHMVAASRPAPSESMETAVSAGMRGRTFQAKVRPNAPTTRLTRNIGRQVRPAMSTWMM